MIRYLPTAFDQPPGRILLYRDAGHVTWGAFLAQACALAQTLPKAAAVFNLCDDRYHFMLAFAAALMRGQTMLLPPSRSAADIARVAQRHPDAYSLVDQPGPHPTGLGWHRVQPQADTPPMPALRYTDPPPTHPVAVLFTSGSTGQPTANGKSWQALSRGVGLGLSRFALGGHTLVATVPPQHMFGLESSVMYALLGDVAVYAGRPFYPEDVRSALAGTAAPRVLVTTPVHLRACLAAGMDWPPVAQIVSATAPLPCALAAEAERQFGARVREIYGSTETGAIASRDTVRSEYWQLFDGMTMTPADGLARVSGPQLPEPVTLNDWVTLADGGRFRLLGRTADLVNVAGKRASLADLNQRLLSIQGVDDGIIVMPEPEAGRTVERPIALVVAPTLDDARLRAALAAVMDPVFVPRPVYRVESLPRNATGKLPRAAVLAQIAALHRNAVVAATADAETGTGTRTP